MFFVSYYEVAEILFFICILIYKYTKVIGTNATSKAKCLKCFSKNITWTERLSLQHKGTLTELEQLAWNRKEELFDHHDIFDGCDYGIFHIILIVWFICFCLYKNEPSQVKMCALYVLFSAHISHYNYTGLLKSCSQTSLILWMHRNL